MQLLRVYCNRLIIKVISVGDQKKNVQKAGKKLENKTNNNSQKEIGGPKGLEPTRYGDWEKNGRCIDF